MTECKSEFNVFLDSLDERIKNIKSGDVVEMNFPMGSTTDVLILGKTSKSVSFLSLRRDSKKNSHFSVRHRPFAKVSLNLFKMYFNKILASSDDLL